MDDETGAYLATVKHRPPVALDPIPIFDVKTVEEAEIIDKKEAKEDKMRTSASDPIDVTKPDGGLSAVIAANDAFEAKKSGDLSTEDLKTPPKKRGRKPKAT